MRKIALILGTPIAIALIVGYFYKDKIITYVDQTKEVQRLEEKKQEVENLIKKFENLIGIEEKEEVKKVSISDFTLELPANFNVSIFAQGLGAPRDLEIGPNRVLHVSVPARDTVYALPDGDGDGVADINVVAADNLNKPHGLATYCGGEGRCKFYVADTDHVHSFDYDGANMKLTNINELVHIPGGGVHHTRSIIFLPPPNDDQFVPER